jgi:hypothetical protein
MPANDCRCVEPHIPSASNDAASGVARTYGRTNALGPALEVSGGHDAHPPHRRPRLRVVPRRSGRSWRAADPRSAAGHTDHVVRGVSLDKQTPADAYSQLSRAKTLDAEGSQQGTSENAGNDGQLDRIGSLTAEQLAAAYGTTKPAAATHASSASADDGTNGWRIAAVTEAALLAALALGSALIVSARRRAPRMGM